MYVHCTYIHTYIHTYICNSDYVCVLYSPVDWLKDIGLPQYQQPFMDARIDARMLDNLSMVSTCTYTHTCTICTCTCTHNLYMYKYKL